MDLPSPVSQKSYERIMRKINLASREVADDSMKMLQKKYQLLEVMKSVSVVTVHGKHVDTLPVLVFVVSLSLEILQGKSTDEEPMHHFCPIGHTSWCKYQKAVATNSASLFKHKNIVPIAVMDEIKPIIVELSAPKLLKKCVGGKTQNANELFNSTVWKYCPKTSVWVI
ncbi:uncharacterized protein TNCV_4807531 [Trichonephila clavipes]|nr:uncharacterized protein TNCV_4807531 [Trichonephila clavipes]